MGNRHGKIFIQQQLLERELLEHGITEGGFKNLAEEDLAAGNLSKGSLPEGFTQVDIEKQRIELRQYEMQRKANSEDKKRKVDRQKFPSGGGHSYPAKPRPRASATVGDLTEGSRDLDPRSSEAYSTSQAGYQAANNVQGLSAQGNFRSQIPNPSTLIKT